MFADQGIDSTSMDAILAASGVSKATNSFGSGREHKRNHLCGLFGAADSKWTSGSAKSRSQQLRGTRCVIGRL